MEGAVRKEKDVRMDNQKIKSHQGEKKGRGDPQKEHKHE